MAQKQWVKHVLTVVIFLLIGALGAILIIPMVKAAQPSDVTIIAEPTSSSALLYFGQDKEIFSGGDVKINATIETMKTPGEALQALVDGHAQFALLPWTEVLGWMSTNPADTFLCLFSVEYKISSPQEGLFAREDVKTKIKKVTDLENKVIGISPGMEIAMNAVIVSAQLDPEKIALEVHPQEELLERMASGEIDLAVFINPYYTLAVQTFGAPMWEGSIFSRFISSPYPASGLFVTKPYFDENPVAVKRMNTGLYLAMMKLGQEADTVHIGVLARQFGLEPAELASFALPTFQKAQDIDKLSVQVMTDRLEFYEAIPAGLNLEDMGIFLSKEDLRQ